MLLSGQIALVTGAGRGVGAAIARGLANEGAVVIVTDKTKEPADRVAAEIRENGGKANSLALDVTDAAQCKRAASDVAALGGLSILVNNAGVRPRHLFDSDERDQAWQQAMQVNLDGVRNTTLAFLGELRKTRGNVINVTSIAAFQASPGSIAYSTSKAAAQMLTKVMALELAAVGVRVNAIAPGVFETEMTRSSRQNARRRENLLTRIPIGRFGQPEELVGPVVFLASPMSSYMTGAIIAVDGGYLAV